MKKTRLILLFRDIQKSIASFTAIAIIVALGTLSYLGISFASEGIKNTLHNYFVTTEYLDLQVRSPKGFSDEDLQSIEELEHISFVNGGYETSAYLTAPLSEDNHLALSVLSLTSDVNQALLIEGEMPVSENECAIEESLTHLVDIGDTIEIDARNSYGVSMLKNDTLTVTGIIHHPSSVLDVEDRRGITTLGNGCVQNFLFVDKSAFDDSLLGGNAQTLYIGTDIKEYSYTPKYQEEVSAIKDSILDLSDAQTEDNAWTVTLRTESLPYAVAEISGDNLKTVGASFGMIFIIVSAMVCYTAFERKIIEQQKLIGMQKAQGFRVSEILNHYLLYALTATTLGVIPGILLAYYVVQPVLVKAYLLNWLLPGRNGVFLPENVLVAMGLAFAINITATCLAVLRTSRKSASELMQSTGVSATSLAKTGNLIRLPGLPLKYTMAIRNLMVNSGKTLTTITVTAGCATLIFSGISVKTSMNQIPDTQFHQLINYEYLVTADTRFGDSSDIEGILETNEDTEYLPVYSYAGTFRYEEHTNMANVTVASPEDINDYFALIEPDTREDITLTDTGIALSVRASEYFGIQPGDEITFTEADGDQYNLKVDSIFDNYVDHVIMMSPEYYEKATDNQVINNQYFIKTDASDITDLQNELKEADTFIRFAKSDYRRGQFDDLSGTMDLIMSILIGLSAILSVTTLFNLNAMTMLQRSRELSIMRANGFTIKETKACITRENRFMMLCGVILGILIGFPLFDYLTGALEPDMMQIPNTISLTALLLSSVLSILFAEIIQAVFLLKLNKNKSIRVED